VYINTELLPDPSWAPPDAEAEDDEDLQPADAEQAQASAEGDVEAK
jgi:hypothetical protein